MIIFKDPARMTTEDLQGWRRLQSLERQDETPEFLPLRKWVGYVQILMIADGLPHTPEDVRRRLVYLCQQGAVEAAKIGGKWCIFSSEMPRLAIYFCRGFLPVELDL